MGCDIHLFTEIKQTNHTEKTEKWLDSTLYTRNLYFGEYPEEAEFLPLKTPASDRSYALFSLLANVRNYKDNFFISEPKGLPEDISEHVKKHFDFASEDYHSASYFTLKELEDFYKEEADNFFKNVIYDIDKKHKLLLPLIEEMRFIAKCHYFHNRPEDVRIVFWFDN